MTIQKFPSYYSTAFVLLLAISGCNNQDIDDPRSLAPLVRIATAYTNKQHDHEFTGVVAARVESNMDFRVTGKIIERVVDTGQMVKKGDLLMRIDPTDLELAYRSQTSTVVSARAHARQTATDRDRYFNLLSAGAVSASAYDRIKAAADAAQAQLNAAEAQANVKKNQLGYAILLADVDGVVLETLGEPGQVVAAGQTVVRLAHFDAHEAVIDLPEGIRPSIGSTAQATLFNGSGNEEIATLRQLSATANPITRTFEARYVLAGTAALAPLGTTVVIRMKDKSTHEEVRLPLSALYDQGQGPGVWVIQDSKPQLTVAWQGVEITSVDAETVSIASGLSDGDQYVALGAHLLHEGQIVRSLHQGADL